MAFNPSNVLSDSNKNNTLEEAYETPTIVKKTFPFEGGLLGQWTAKARLIAYQSEGNNSKIKFTVKPGEDFIAIVSNVHVDKVGIVKVNECLIPQLGNGSPNKKFFLARGLKKGDIIGVICYAGEGFCYVWLKGRLGCIDMSWVEDNPKLKKGEWVRRLGKWTLWVKIKNQQNKIGWLMIREDDDLSKIKGWSRYR